MCKNLGIQQVMMPNLFGPADQHYAEQLVTELLDAVSKHHYIYYSLYYYSTAYTVLYKYFVTHGDFTDPAE